MICASRFPSSRRFRAVPSKFRNFLGEVVEVVPIRPTLVGRWELHTSSAANSRLVPARVGGNWINLGIRWGGRSASSQGNRP